LLEEAPSLIPHHWGGGLETTSQPCVSTSRLPLLPYSKILHHWLSMPLLVKPISEQRIMQALSDHINGFQSVTTYSRDTANS